MLAIDSTEMEKPAIQLSGAAIIANLQSFLLEMGQGFCFEARQNRITFDNTHYHIDLKIGEFSHADAGQMNVYLNYYKENESQKGDNPPTKEIFYENKRQEYSPAFIDS